MNKPVAGLTPDGRSTRWSGHRVVRREELIDAAVAVINEHGPDVGVDAIAAAARTSKPVIYRYFADKDDLYRAVGERVVRDIVATLQTVQDGTGDTDDPQVMLRAAIDGFLQLVEDNPGLFRFVNREGLPPGGPIAGVLAVALAEQLRLCGLDTAAAAPWSEAAIGFIRSASLWWLANRDQMTREQLREFLAALLWGGAAGVYQSAGRDVDARPAPGVFPTPRGGLPSS